LIVREENDRFVCIEQNHHAHLAKEMMMKWKLAYLSEDPLADSVLYAIEQHDVGWDYFDKQPFWNDKLKRPYTFIDLPLLIKTIVYTRGVNIISERDPYAASLSSAHYSIFLEKYSEEAIRQYIMKEKLRRQQILTSYPEINDEKFQYHLALLQLADNLSLFICLHDPHSPESRHRYFEKGIAIPKPIDFKHKQFIQPNWIDERTVELENITYVSPFNIHLREKYVLKETINKDGWMAAYENTRSQKREIEISVKKSF